MRNPGIGLLRSDMAELQDAWETGQASRAEGWALDPRHDALLYASLVLLGMHGLIELSKLCMNRWQTRVHQGRDCMDK